MNSKQTMNDHDSGRRLTGERLPNTIQQASAGTGKTFALSNRYLSLLARGVTCDAILAVTFTRKGAGEILDRIIQRLAAAAADENRAAELSRFVGVTLSRNQATELLRSLVRRLHRLQIGTIDSYFFRVAQSFTAELGLPFDWQIAEEAALEDTKYQAIESMLVDDQVSSLLHLISNADAGRRVSDVIQQTVDVIYQVHRESEPTAWRKLSDFSRPSEERIQDLLQRGRGIVGTNKQYQKWQTDLDALESGDWDTLRGSTLLLRVHAGEYEYSGALASELIGPAQELAAIVRDYVCWELDCRNQAALTLVAHYAKALFPRQQVSGNMRFDDVAWLLSRLALEHRSSFVARLDQAAEHLLLDEFQDTSPEQWRIIEPIADQVTRPAAEDKQAGTFFCVGDRKQAIYGWRGGVAAIFDVVEQRLEGRLVASPPLVESYRSSPPVIETVNRVFQNLNRATTRGQVDRGVLNDWQASFPPHSTAKPNLPGWVELIQVAPPSETADSGALDPVLKSTVEAIERAYRAHPTTSIGVLVRANDPIVILRHELQLRGIPASEEGGNPLTDSVAVNTLLAGATLVDHPLDGPARFLLSHSPLASEFGLLPETCVTQAKNIQISHRSAARWRRTIAERGLPFVLESWAKRLAEGATQREIMRMQQLLDIALNDDPTWSMRPSKFVSYIEQQRVIDAASARVRIMTVHASKGLEFDVVVAPVMNKQSGWTSRAAEFIFTRPAPDRLFDVVSRSIASDQRVFLPEPVRESFEKAEQDTVQGELCVLYVLLTRAIHQLSLIVSHKAKPSQYSPAGVLLASLASPATEGNASNLGEPVTKPKGRRGSKSMDAVSLEAAQAVETSGVDVVLYAHGDPHWAEKWKNQQATEGQMAKQSVQASLDDFYRLSKTANRSGTSPHLSSGMEVNPDDLQSPGVTQTLSAVSRPAVGPDSGTSASPSQHARRGAAGRRLGNHWVDREQREARLRGQWLHACFQCLEWLENPPSDAQLRTRLKSIGVTGRRAANVIQQFRETCQRPNLAMLYQREQASQRAWQRWYPSSRPLIEPLRFEVHNERRFSRAISNSQFVEGVIDRLVLIYEGASLVAAEFLDLKTEIVPPEAVGPRAAFHRPQLEAYRQAATEFLRFDSPMQIVGWLVFSECDQVSEITDFSSET